MNKLKKEDVSALLMIILNGRAYGFETNKKKTIVTYISAGELFTLGIFSSKVDAIAACALNANRLWHDDHRDGRSR